MTGYPGETVRIANFKSVDGNDLGDVRVQRYAPNLYRVAAFLPGIIIDLPGDTPKLVPERSEWSDTLDKAAMPFERFVIDAIKDGWTVV